jgi:hypothetical protein
VWLNFLSAEDAEDAEKRMGMVHRVNFIDPTPPQHFNDDLLLNIAKLLV